MAFYDFPAEHGAYPDHQSDDTLAVQGGSVLVALKGLECDFPYHKVVPQAITPVQVTVRTH